MAYLGRILVDIFANLTLTVFAELSRGFPLHPLRCLTNSVGQMLLSQIIIPNNKRVADGITSDPHDFSGKDSQVDQGQETLQYIWRIDNGIFH